jgi:hypothetical protein
MGPLRLVEGRLRTPPAGLFWDLRACPWGYDVWCSTSDEVKEQRRTARAATSLIPWPSSVTQARLLLSLGEPETKAGARHNGPSKIGRNPRVTIGKAQAKSTCVVRRKRRKPRGLFLASLRRSLLDRILRRTEASDESRLQSACVSGKRNTSIGVGRLGAAGFVTCATDGTRILPQAPYTDVESAELSTRRSSVIARFCHARS